MAQQILPVALHSLQPLRITLGCPVLDGLLRGGLRCGSITEITGATENMHCCCKQIEQQATPRQGFINSWQFVRSHSTQRSVIGNLHLQQHVDAVLMPTLLICSS